MTQATTTHTTRRERVRPAPYVPGVTLATDLGVLSPDARIGYKSAWIAFTMAAQHVIFSGGRRERAGAVAVLAEVDARFEALDAQPVTSATATDDRVVPEVRSMIQDNVAGRLAAVEDVRQMVRGLRERVDANPGWVHLRPGLDAVAGPLGRAIDQQVGFRERVAATMATLV